jgi:hypothetical protein
MSTSEQSSSLANDSAGSPQSRRPATGSGSAIGRLRHFTTEPDASAATTLSCRRGENSQIAFQNWDKECRVKGPTLHAKGERPTTIRRAQITIASLVGMS